ncbi:MAG: RNA polymerase sigma factor, partial [Deltaproteobacteria bacterium]|nr:RNA polymerase sigma factor [Deltaproteobacteria bacterium]
MDELHERALLRQALAGNEASFTALVKDQTSFVVRLAWRLVGNRDDAEEIAQEAFLRLHRALPNFRGDSRLQTWLYRTTTRLAIDHLRRERLRRRWFVLRKANNDPDPTDWVADPNRLPEEAVATEQAMRQLQQFLKQLSPRQQAVFVLRHYEGLSLDEIADHLGLETGTVKSHLHRAVSHLR